MLLKTALTLDSTDPVRSYAAIVFSNVGASGLAIIDCKSCLWSFMAVSNAEGKCEGLMEWKGGRLKGSVAQSCRRGLVVSITISVLMHMSSADVVVEDRLQVVLVLEFLVAATKVNLR